MDIVGFSSFTILLSLFIFLIMLFKVTTHFKSKSSNLPPGPRKLPLIGNIHLLATSQPPHHTLTHLALKYGAIMHLQLGEVTTIVVSSPEAAKQVLKTHDTTFASRPSLFTSQIMCYGNTDIAFAPYGEYWRQLRKICTLELLSTKRLQSFQPIREEEFSSLCRWIASKAGSSINLTERVELTNYDIVTRASLGKKTKEQETFISTLKQGIEIMGGFHIADVYPSIKLFHLVGGMKGRMERLHQELDRILETIINKHKTENAVKNVTDESEKQEDLVDVLLKFHDAGDGFHLSTDNIKAVLQDMFTGGTETSSATVDWAMAEMLKNPRILQKAQNEVRRVFEEKGYVDEFIIHELKYLKLVIKETLRMHPPVPLLVPRENGSECEINGYKIPAKARVLVNAWAIGRDPKYWKEAESFKPERFLDNSVDYKGNSFEYIPFGAGKRICPGISFGLANVELPLAMLLYHFDWSLPDGMEPKQVDMRESCGITARRKNPLYVIPRIRKPMPCEIKELQKVDAY